MTEIQPKRFTASTPHEAFMQHMIEKASVHWPRKDLSKGKPAKLSNQKAPAWFNRQTARSPSQNHRTAWKKKFTM